MYLVTTIKQIHNSSYFLNFRYMLHRLLCNTTDPGYDSTKKNLHARNLSLAAEITSFVIYEYF